MMGWNVISAPPHASEHVTPRRACVRASSVWLTWARWPRQGHHCEVVGGHVAPPSTPHLHQAPLGVAAFVPGLQDPDRLPGTNRHFVFSSGGEVKGCKDLEETFKAHAVGSHLRSGRALCGAHASPGSRAEPGAPGTRPLGCRSVF